VSFEFTYPKCFILISIIPYVIYHFTNCAKIKDERDEYISLQAFKIVQRVTIAALLIMAIVNFFFKNLDAQIVLTVTIIASLYSEMIARWALRCKY
jgi:multidrug efflux pump subunit AcrB